MIDKLIKEVEGVFGMTPPRKRSTRTSSKKRSYSAPARRTRKRTTKRPTRRRR